MHNSAPGTLSNREGCQANFATSARDGRLLQVCTTLRCVAFLLLLWLGGGGATGAIAGQSKADSAGLTPQLRALARAIGIEGAVTSFYENKCHAALERPGSPSGLCLGLRQEITESVLLASLQVSGVAAFLDSEEERAEQAANLLAERERSFSKTLTALAIGVGAVGAVAVGITGRDRIGIATGGTEAVLGLAMLRNRKTVRFDHPRNPLRDFWFARRDGTIFPSAVWAYFDNTPAGTDPALNIREHLKQTWANLHGLGGIPRTRNAGDTPLLLGDGGLYSRSQLRLRADLLDQLEALVNTMHEELKTLFAGLLVSRTSEGGGLQ